MIHIYVGPDAKYLHDLVKKEVSLKLNNDINEFNYSSFDMFNSLIQDAVEACETTSFFSSTKCVVIDNCYFLSSSEIKVPSFSAKQDIDSLTKYVRGQNPDTEAYLIVVGKLISDKKNELLQALKETSEFVIKDELTKETMIELGMNYVGQNKGEIDRKSIEEICARVKNDYSLLFLTLDKLLTYTSKIRLCDVQELVYKPLEDNVFSIVECLFQGNAKTAMINYRDLIKGGQDALRLMPVFASQIRFMYEVCFLHSQRMIDNQIVKELKCNPYRVKFALRSISNMPSSIILKILADLGEMEKHIKYDLDNANDQMELFIINFKSNYLIRK